MKTLTVLYDQTCPLCVRCREWMEHQTAFVALEFLACRSAEAARRYGSVPWLGDELVVVADDGRAWVGAAAFLVCLWALEDWRVWSYRLSGPTLAPLAERFFHAISTRRRRWAILLGFTACDDGRCRVPAATPYR